MLRAIYQNKFLRDMEIAKKRKKDMAKLEEMMNKLLAGSKLFSRAQNHRLKGGALQAVGSVISSLIGSLFTKKLRTQLFFFEQGPIQIFSKFSASLD